MVDLNIWPQVACHHKVVFFVFVYLYLYVCIYANVCWWLLQSGRHEYLVAGLPAANLQLVQYAACLHSLTSALLPSHWSALELELSDWSMTVAARGFQYGRGLRAAPRGQTAPSAFCYTALDSGLNLDTKLPQS